jgi:gamma-glutamyltranspeptidase/glutathione hydrolase
MIATAHHRATEAGVEILMSGGNAIDAAVAAAFALGVCEPTASGLGGQTMMMIYHAESGRTIALDGSSRAPNRATREAVRGRPKTVGYSAATVPSTYALETYGTLNLTHVLEPAIRLAEEGYVVSDLQYRLARRELKSLKANTAAPLFLRDGRRPYPAGTLHKQPELAQTLRRLAERGVRDFYDGEVAQAIDRDMAANGGLIGLDDLAQVPRPLERGPLHCRYGPYRVLTFPLPGAGRTLVEMLHVYQRLPARLRDIDTPEGAVALAHAIRQAFRDRRDRPFDPNFYTQINQKKMLSLTYAKTLAQKIAEDVDTRGDTTHLSAMDQQGNVVALTQSIQSVYGSFCASPELGFLYNDYMDAFEYDDMSHPYYLRPNAVPWASVAPTIVFRGTEPWLAIGSPGSERITPSILQVLVRLQKQSPLAAVDAPRLHCSIAGKVSLEAPRMSDEIPHMLEQHGFEVDPREPYSFYLGCVQLVMRKQGRLTGVADPRRDGSAGGPR